MSDRYLDVLSEGQYETMTNDIGTIFDQGDGEWYMMDFDGDDSAFFVDVDAQAKIVTYSGKMPTVTRGEVLFTFAVTDGDFDLAYAEIGGNEVDFEWILTRLLNSLKKWINP